MKVSGEVPDTYADFASYAAGDSHCFEEWAHGVAGDPEVVEWLQRLPEPKRQPNLVFAAARWHGVPAPGPYAGLRDALLGDESGVSIGQTILARATQTNEVGRLATLTPAFARLARGRPLSLIEVGASAGLCLYPDRWAYDWTDEHETSHRAGSGVGPLSCRVTGQVPYPTEDLVVAHRTGIDLHPLDVTDADAMAWLETLVWPEHDDRRALLQQAVEVARADPPLLATGDLLPALPGLVAEAASVAPGATVVVFHSAVIAYLEAPDQQDFHDLMTGLVADGACHWVSNEAARVLPRVAATGPDGQPSGTFVLGVDGQAAAWTHGHGRSMAWFG